MTATVQEAKEFASLLSDEYLRCRRYGHRWNDYDVREDRRVNVFSVTEQCPSCESERSYEISGVTGRMISDYSIKYSEGYLSEIGRLSGDARGMLVVELLRRRVKTVKAPPATIRAKRKTA